MRFLRRSTAAAALLASSLAPCIAAAAPDAPLPHAKPPAEPSGDAPPVAPPPDAPPAAPPPDAPPAALVPPTPLTPLGADYPAGAHGDATVRLVLTVNADGTVRSAIAEEGMEPFASAAVAAATAFRFAPATRNGAPVAARIRVEVRFTEAASPAPPGAPATTPPGASAPAPPGASAPAPPGASATAPERPATAAGPAPSAPRPIEVTVRGEQPAPGVSSLSRGEVRIVPGAFGDPFRALEVLPGVTPIVSGLPFFYVRGSPPGNVGYFLDGIRVPYLYHLGLGPSVVHPGIVDRVDLYPGGYPARHGRYAGGIVAGETTPPLPYWHGEGMLRLVDVGGLVEGPFAGNRGVALVGGRYSYTALLLSLAAPEVALDYWDYQARLSYEVAPQGRVSLFAFGAHDFLASEEDGEKTTLFDTTFHRLDLRYDHTYGQGSALRGALTLGHDETGIGDGQKALTRSLGARLSLAHRLRDETMIRAGIDAVIDDNELDLGTDADGPPGDDDDVPVDDLLLSRVDVTVGGYIESDIAITRRLRITPGLRLDLYHSDDTVALAVDPRLSARLSLGRGVTFVQAHGIASQLPSFVVPIPGFRPALKDGLQRSFQSSAGVELALPQDITATVSVFHNAFFNMTDALGSLGLESVEDAFTLRALGAATGVELSAHRRLTRRVGGFASYTLSRSTRSIGRSRQLSSFDRTHVANVALTYDLGRGYRAGGRFVFYSGLPQRIGGATLPPISGVPGGSGSLAGGAPRWERLPPFFRLDVRLEKRWSIGKSGWLSVVLDVLNATLSKETMPGMCDAFSSCEPTTFGPVTVPNFGLEGGF